MLDKEIKMTKIEIYPKVSKPKWLKPGVWCYCLGEAYEKFIVDQVFSVNATLINEAGYDHGLESFSKLYQDLNELENRRPELK